MFISLTVVTSHSTSVTENKARNARVRTRHARVRAFIPLSGQRESKAPVTKSSRPVVRPDVLPIRFPLLGRGECPSGVLTTGVSRSPGPQRSSGSRAGRRWQWWSRSPCGEREPSRAPSRPVHCRNQVAPDTDAVRIAIGHESHPCEGESNSRTAPPSKAVLLGPNIDLLGVGFGHRYGIEP